MARALLFQTECGASGDMILASLIDLLDNGDEFKKTFENIGLNVKVLIEDTERNHLRCKQVTIEASGHNHATTRPEIEAIIAATPFSREIKDNANRVFGAIFAAEAAVHGSDMENVHLHEVGAADSLVDILGFCFLWEKLAYCPVYFTILVTGCGSVRTRHGVLPVPPPAVLRLVQGFTCRSGDIASELLTPTGAAILTTFGRQAGGERTASPVKTGYGCGHKTFAETPNLLRAVLEEREEMSSTGGIWVLECNLDDMSPEILAHAAEKIVQMGALDIFIASGLGKKGRPGFQMTVLCHDNEREKVISTIFNESTAIGLRQRYSDRVVLQREMQSIRIEGREVHLKIGSWQGQMLNVKPEFADVRRLAEDLDIPLKKAMQTVLGAIHEKHGLGKD